MSDDEKREEKSPGEAPEGIPELRDEINRLDEEIIRLLAARRDVSHKVILAKDAGRSPIRDHEREEELLVRRIRQGRDQGLDAHFVTRIFHEIIDDSVRLQQEYLQSHANEDGDGEPGLIRIAFQGIEGAYSHLAGQKFFARYGDRLQFLGRESFEEVIQSVESGQADYAMLPIENTTSGGINEVYDLLLHTRLSIVGEEKFQVRHCLVASAEVPPSSLGKVFSHPQAVAQCRDFLKTLHGCKVETFTDTAMSVARVKEENDPTQAAIASEEAAKMFGLYILERDIANQPENYTRFLVAARKAREVDTRIPCKTSLVMATGQKAGSLVESLLIFRDNEINLTKLESRPILGNPWEEMFYIDLEGNIAEAKVKRALDALTRTARFIKVLGTYPSQDLPKTTPSPDKVSAARADAASETIGAAGAAGAAPTPSTSAVAEDSASYRLASRAHKAEDTVLDVKGVRIGERDFTVIAGPCAIESRDQILACARTIKEHGGQVLRGGCYRRRSSPHSFEGLGDRALELLAEAGRTYGLPIVTEVIAPEDVERVARVVDILEVGAPNMQDYHLLRELGRTHRPVLLARGGTATVLDLLEAAQYMLAQGNQQVILCEEGIRTFETAYRMTLDFNAIPMLRRRTHLPIFVNPSAATGDREFVPPLALASRPTGAAGVVLEIHPDPANARVAGGQALDFREFEELTAALHAGGR